MKRKLLLWIMSTGIYKKFLGDILPYIRFSTYYSKMTGLKYHYGYKLLKPGHIILTVDKSKLSTKLIGGEFSHAALCVGKGGAPMFFEVAEMTHKDFTESYFFDLCKEADRVVILNCVDWNENYKIKVIQKCHTFQGAKYDQKFKLGVEALYCSELIYEADFARKLKVSLEDLAGMGRPYISPDGLYKAKNVEVVWDSDK